MIKTIKRYRVSIEASHGWWIFNHTHTLEVDSLGHSDIEAKAHIALMLELLRRTGELRMNYKVLTAWPVQ